MPVAELQTRLRDSEETRKRLLANFVHELGRPLGALQAAIHALQQGADNDPALRQELLQGMDGQVERLKPLLDNLASLHGACSSALALNRVSTDLSAWLPGILVGWRAAAEQKRLTWVQEIPSNLPPVNMDADRMAQVIGNLLSNAIKYTPEGAGEIRIGAAQQGNEIRIKVRDTGIGISKEDLAHIFDPFYRGHNARFPQGMGLGLSIARDVVNAHGGRITAESELGKGSVFTVSLAALNPLQQKNSRCAAGTENFFIQSIFSKIPAAPMPPPMHIVTMPYCDLRRFISWMSCTVSFAPVAPSG